MTVVARCMQSVQHRSMVCCSVNVMPAASVVLDNIILVIYKLF